jgi:hypothetical protein
MSSHSSSRQATSFLTFRTQRGTWWLPASEINQCIARLSEEKHNSLMPSALFHPISFLLPVFFASIHRNIIVLETGSLPASEVLLHVPWWTLLVWVILAVLVTIVRVVKLLAAVPRLALRPLTIDVVGAPGLGQLVDLSTGETGEKLLGELVGDWLAYTNLLCQKKKYIEQCRMSR